MKQSKTIISLSEQLLRKVVKEIVTKIIKTELKDYPNRYELDSKLERLERKIDDNARSYRDQILTKMDDIVGELAQIREDNLFRDRDIKELQEKISLHDNEISKLKHS